MSCITRCPGKSALKDHFLKSSTMTPQHIMKIKWVAIFTLAIWIADISCSLHPAKNKAHRIVALSGKNKASCVSFATDPEGYPIATWAETDPDNRKNSSLRYLKENSSNFQPPMKYPLNPIPTCMKKGCQRSP